MPDLLNTLKQLVANLEAQQNTQSGPAENENGLDSNQQAVLHNSHGRPSKMNIRQPQQSSIRPQIRPRPQPHERAPRDHGLGGPHSGWRIVDPYEGWTYVEPCGKWKSIIRDKIRGTDTSDGNNKN